MGGELDEGVDALMQLALASEAANGNEEASHHVSTRGGGRGAARGVAEDYEEWEGEDEGGWVGGGIACLAAVAQPQVDPGLNQMS
jgi:hypothetical protein